MSPVRSTRTRFRQNCSSLGCARDFGSGLPLRSRPLNASTSKPAGGISDVADAFNSHTLPPKLQFPQLQRTQEVQNILHLRWFEALEIADHCIGLRATMPV